MFIPFHSKFRSSPVASTGRHVEGDASQVDQPALVRRAKHGDRRAFARLWQDHAPTVHAVVVAMVPPGLAEDLVQDVAVAALSQIATLRNESGFAAWLCAIARNRARNARATMRRCRASADVDALADQGEPSDRLVAGEILAALRSLPETYRQPLSLRFLRGLSGPEIARQLGMTPGSVRVNLCRGMKLLRDRLVGRGRDGADA